MGASDKPLRFRTALLLLQEHGPTMTTDQVRADAGNGQDSPNVRARTRGVVIMAQLIMC